MMQELYCLEATRPVEKEEIYEKTVKGEKVEATRKKKSKEQTTLVLLRPNAAMVEESEFYFGQQYNRYINAGYLTRAMMSKKIADVGGLGTEHDEDLKENMSVYLEATRVIEFYGGSTTLSKEQKEKLKKAEEDFAATKAFIIDYQNNMSSVFNQTAEAQAEQKITEWFLINFLNIKETVDGEDNYFSFFEGVEYEDKKAHYLALQDESEENENDEFLKKKYILDNYFERMVRALTIWRNGLGSDQKTIDAAIKELF